MKLSHPIGVKLVRISILLCVLLIGSTCTEKARLRGNADPENSWQGGTGQSERYIVFGVKLQRQNE